LRGEQVKLTRPERREVRRLLAERMAAIRSLYAAGWTRPEIAARLGLDYEAVPEHPGRKSSRPAVGRDGSAVAAVDAGQELCNHTAPSHEYAVVAEEIVRRGRASADVAGAAA
jgi:hypothetical protein